LTVIIMIASIIGYASQGYFVKHSGYAGVAFGTAVINITSGLSITLIDLNISLGNGTIDQSSDFAILESTGADAVNGTWAPVNDPFVLENGGNVYANITITAAVDASTWFGGTPTYAAMYFNYTEYEENSCLLHPAVGHGTWAALPSLDENQTCQKLNFSESSDAMRIDIRLHVPADAPPGKKENSITFTAMQSE